jgi:pyruvate dehydrogenase E2 component (dihydrolipoamide acetyltransferase)
MTDGRHLVEATSMRSAIARRMTQSKQQVPHFYVSTEIEMDVLAEAAERQSAARDPSNRATLTAYLIRAVALTLVEHPAFNAVWAGETLERWDAINIGVAIAVDDGLIAPALLGCSGRSVDDIAAGLRDLTARTRGGRLKAAELTDATFTLSNLGMFEVTQFAAIVVPPQVAILATGRGYERPVVRDVGIVVRRVINATISADHRAVDGADAARFLGTLKSLIETPGGWAPGEDVT